MPKLHIAAPGTVCIHFLALSSSFCIWSRLCALLAQLVHHSSRHVQVGTHRNRLGQPGQTKAFPHIRHYFNLIHRIDAVEGRLKRANQQGTNLACYISENLYRYIALNSVLANADPYKLVKVWSKKMAIIASSCIGMHAHPAEDN